MLYLLDTNILLRGLIVVIHTVRRALIMLRRQGMQPCLAAQNLVEFWAVATRPVDANGLASISTQPR